MSNPQVHVVLPFFRSMKWFKPCVQLLRSRADNPQGLKFTLVAQWKEPYDVQEASALASWYDLDMVKFPTKARVGATDLPEALKLGVNAFKEAPVTLLCDSDALVLSTGWDTRIMHTLSGGTVVAGINPRGDTREFKNQVEWNFCAFSTQWWLDHVKTFDRGDLHDLGHVLTAAALRTGSSQHLWPCLYHPIPGKAATVCSRDGVPFVFHAFYSTRKVGDVIPVDEHPWILTTEQEDKLIADCVGFKP